MSQGQYVDLGRALMEDPITTHQMLRNESPVFRSNELGVVLVTRHEDVSRVLLDSGTFSSEYFAHPYVEPGTSARSRGDPRDRLACQQCAVAC